ncbi:hypothetical protein [Marinicellulosiphila megalodicopiae]|uniref:hypothetical protein n=1 Tax=Marinicellulosiphila megalodicopiae TaxID=2724896 RepID=UPI003BAEAB29
MNRIIKIFSIAFTMATLGLQANATSIPPANALEIGGDFTKVAIDGKNWTVYYGANGTFVTLSGTGKSPMQCEPNTFGIDPVPNVPKKCFVSGTDIRVIPSRAKDFGTFTPPGNGMVMYGVHNKFLTKNVTGGAAFSCAPATFGSDPAPNIPKNCFFFPQCQVNSPDNGKNLGWGEYQTQIQTFTQCLDPERKITPSNYTYTFDFAANSPFEFPGSSPTWYVTGPQSDQVGYMDLYTYKVVDTKIVKIKPPVKVLNNPELGQYINMTVESSGFAPADVSFFVGPTCSVPNPQNFTNSAMAETEVICGQTTLPSNFQATVEFSFATGKLIPLIIKPNNEGKIYIPAGKRVNGDIYIGEQKIDRILTGKQTGTIRATGLPDIQYSFDVN